MKYSIISIFLSFFLVSCSNDCLTCKLTAPDRTELKEEYCDDGNTNFTDQFGEIITYDEFITQQENMGYICN